MSYEIEGKVKELENENLELKLSSIRKDLVTLKIDVHTHLEENAARSDEKFERILEQTSKTNGSVGKALEKIAVLELEDYKSKIEKLQKTIEEHKKQTKPWTIISTNKWVRIVLIGLAILAGLQLGTGVTLFQLIKLAI